MNVVLEGTILPGRDRANAIAQLATLIKRNVEFAGRLLIGRPTTIKSGVDAATAARYVAALEHAGVAVRLEPETLEIDADLAAATNVADHGRAPCQAGGATSERLQPEGEFRGNRHQLLAATAELKH